MRANVMKVFALVAVIVSLIYVGTLTANPSSGFSGSTIAVGRFGEIDVTNHAFFPESAPGDTHPGKDLWLSLQKTKR